MSTARNSILQHVDERQMYRGMQSPILRSALSLLKLSSALIRSEVRVFARSETHACMHERVVTGIDGNTVRTPSD